MAFCSIEVYSNTPNEKSERTGLVFFLVLFFA